MTWLQLVLLIGATWRLAHLVTEDEVPLGPVRRWFDRTYTGTLVDLWHCAWCVSMYIGAVCLVLTIFFWDPWKWFEAVFTASVVAGWLESR